MGNCCGSSTPKKSKKPNPFYQDDFDVPAAAKAPKVLQPKSGALGMSVQEGQDITEKYVLGKELGRGEFGVTYICTDKETQEVLACKSISKAKLRTALDLEDVRREIAVMHHLPPHPNIVIFKGVYEDDNAVHLLMELCEGGELFDRIVARGHYTERAAATIAKTIIEVIQVCHKNGVMHRDLKPENFLFANKKESSPLKAIDFGLSIFFKPGERFNEIVGSPYYMAPEVLRRNYGPEIDVWSAGVIFYILLCGVPPFWAETEQGVAREILRGNVVFKRDPWPKVSENAKSLIRQMLEPDPKLRLTAQQVFEHPWLQDTKKVSNMPLGDVVRTRLMQFSAMNKLKKKVLEIIADQLSVEEVEGVKETFEKLDVDKDGVISIDELRNGLHHTGFQFSEEEIKHLMDSADSNKNGTLDYQEFAALVIHVEKMYDDDDHLQKAFTYLDKDGNGFIDKQELVEAIQDDLGPNDDLISHILLEVDVDKDGQISFQEFALMMRSGMDWRKASKRYSRGRFNNLSIRVLKDVSFGIKKSGTVVDGNHSLS
ncbi:hypothetical protein O6H91_14G039300 [Diphasiastrum complanatum]|uniref:Uncharacterized protein n=4 Tax=Diphasiastrum complanatum TaxID=34168 RepID=A0ACC2BNL5_DIPCM|nr:hypothetical protein O6H91_14G039300 [Diphasiastrum complanatum]KAJ7531293.1 hypothetical protein O6H91_14G039300 [Diphasiastrum complanatum]KAJ7531294.1 hypothetical protein O6H91_14G039300 [Diphasiastrum complanatum]KAJ7531295.1 hypothetical protein O6H91_14G039300 [Diphasiastrum complanatum]